MDTRVWTAILEQHEKIRDQQLAPLFLRGLEILELTSKHLPRLDEVNKKLAACTGFQGVFVAGLEDGKSFFKLLSEKKFPIGEFIRDYNDLSYTPAPDIVHDLYGHLPFYTDPKYADFSQKLALQALEIADDPDLLRQYERFFWFTLEFALIETSKGLRIFGAGIASSVGECRYALSGEPQLLPFDVQTICQTEFRIDEMQKKLFVLKNEEQLYQSLPLLPRRTV